MKCKEIWSAVKGGALYTLPEEIVETLLEHDKHHLELVQYAGLYHAIECTDCNEVIFDDETLYTEE